MDAAEQAIGPLDILATTPASGPTPYFHTYNATKHGVVGFSHSLRGELADSPVSISVICPGFISGVGMLGRIEDQVDVPASLGTLPPRGWARRSCARSATTFPR